MSLQDVRDLRDAFGTFATGVTIVTTHVDGRDVGITANSFSSVSLDPPLILWSLDRRSGSLNLFEAAAGFAVHVLASDQEELSNRFASNSADKFGALDFERGRWSVPLLGGCAARFECRKAFAYDGGDHVILVGEVFAYEHSHRAPLLFHGGRYKLASDHRRRAPEDLPLATQLSLANLACRRAAIAMALDHGIAWTDVTILGALVQRGPSSAAALNEILRQHGVLWDEATRTRLVGAGFAKENQAQAVATPEGRDFVSNVAAAVRAAELEMRIRHEAQFVALEMATDELLEAIAPDEALASTIASLHRAAATGPARC